MFDCAGYFNSLDMFGIRLGLAATQELMERAGHPEKDLCFIHIAGTNGKGSTGAMLERCLRQAGIRTGFYTSPHLIDIRERFRINGRAVSEEEFNCAGAELAGEAAGGRFSYFEFATVLAMKIFQRANVDAVIWETGLGGRLDATNAVIPQVSVITNIALDHQGHLGNTLAEIAGEKAGIIKKGVPLFHGVLPPEAHRVIVDRAAELAAPVFPPSAAVPELDSVSGGCQHFTYEGRKFSLSLPGRMQRENFRIVCEVLKYLSSRWGFPLEKAFEGLPQVRWPARFQHLNNNMIIDGGHNPDGVCALTEAVTERYGDKKFLIVYAAFGDKHSPECLKYLEKIASRFIFTVPGAEGRAVYSPEELQQFTDVPSEVAADPSAAVKTAVESGCPVIVSGSLYLAGTALKDCASLDSVLNI